MSEDSKKIKVFQGNKVRTHWDPDKEKWFFSIIDIIAILTESARPRKYWADLKAKLNEEGSELSDKIGQLKMIFSDGKYYLTDVGDTEQILRLIQSIPSKKAEPFKIWLARVGSESIDEVHNPELAEERMKKLYENIYKLKTASIFNNLRVVSMIPSDSQELLDVFNISIKSFRRAF
jgi:hypothetical protein